MYFKRTIPIVLPNVIVIVVTAVNISRGGDFLGHSYVYVGDALLLTCILSDSLLEQGFTAENISFTVSHQLKTKCFTGKHVVRVVNSSTAVLSLPNITATGRARYTCLVGSHHCDSVNTELSMVGRVHEVTVQYRPHEVTNFECVERNRLDSITCTWQHPVSYDVDLGDTEVTFRYKYKYLRSSGDPAVCTDLRFVSCVLKDPLDCAIDANVTVTNSITHDSAGSNYVCDTSDKIQLSSVKDLSIEKVIGQDGCFQLSWNHGESLEKIYRVSHQGSDSARLEAEIIGNNLTAMNYNVCGLRPFTVHNFSVQCYPVGRKGYWSEPTILLDYWTPEQAPYLGPETTYGSFSSTSCDDKNYQYTTTLFWKEVQRSARNGLITNYVVKFDGRVLSRVDSNSYTATFELSCETSPVDIEIAAVNSAGESKLTSVITVARLPGNETDSLNAPAFSIALNGSKAIALWDPSYQVDNKSVTIFWCYESEQSSCKGPIDWMHIQESQSYLDIPELPSEPIKFRFGISSNAIKDESENWKKRISGIQWTNCFHNQKPTVLSSPKIRSVEPGDECATVSWIKIPCTKESNIKLTGYRIMWCEHNQCKDARTILSVDLTTTFSSYIVSGLQSSTNYKVTVLSKVDELLSQEYEWIEMTPAVTENMASKILIVVFATLAVVIIGTLVILFAQYCCISKQKMKNLLTEIQSQKADLANHSGLENGPSCSGHSGSSEPIVKTTCYFPSKSEVPRLGDIADSESETPHFVTGSIPGYLRNSVRLTCSDAEGNISKDLQEHNDGSSSVADYTLMPAVIKDLQGHNDGSSSEADYSLMPAVIKDLQGHNDGSSSEADYSLMPAVIKDLQGHNDWSSSIADYTLMPAVINVKQDVPSESDEKTEPLLGRSEGDTKMEWDISAVHRAVCDDVSQLLLEPYRPHMLPQPNSYRSRMDDNIFENSAPKNCLTSNHLDYISVFHTNINHPIAWYHSFHMNLQNLTLDSSNATSPHLPVHSVAKRHPDVSENLPHQPVLTFSQVSDTSQKETVSLDTSQKETVSLDTSQKETVSLDVQAASDPCSEYIQFEISEYPNSKKMVDVSSNGRQKYVSGKTENTLIKTVSGLLHDSTNKIWPNLVSKSGYVPHRAATSSTRTDIDITDTANTAHSDYIQYPNIQV